jgi:hypothetical protein
MEEVEAVANLRQASAVFRWQQRAWTTDGWAIFNLTPEKAIEHYGKQLAPVKPPTHTTGDPQ